MYMNLPMGSLTCVIAKKIKASSTYDFKLYVVLSKNFAIRTYVLTRLSSGVCCDGYLNIDLV